MQFQKQSRRALTLQILGVAIELTGLLLRIVADQHLAGSLTNLVGSIVLLVGIYLGVSDRGEKPPPKTRGSDLNPA